MPSKPTAASAASSDRVLLVCSQSFDGGLDDGTSFKGVRDKVRVWSDHPAARKWPQFFEPITVTHESPRRVDPPKVEAATAAPGEVRE